VTAPEAGFRIMVMVERACSPEAEPILKFAFDLFKKIGNELVEIVHISFTANTPVERQGIETMAVDGVPPKAARILRKEVFPIAKELETRKPTAEEKAALKSAMSRAATTTVEL
jgi:hypothetical protein